MSPFTMDALVLDRCTTCEGVWFDARELSEYGDKMGLGRMRVRRAKRAPESVEGLSCPNCGRAGLAPSDLDSLTSYGCTECGGWFLSGAAMHQLERRYTEHQLAEGFHAEADDEQDSRSHRLIASIRGFFFR
jgi:Zn-finger nucleic acid-binding protein